MHYYLLDAVQVEQKKQIILLTSFTEDNTIF